MRYLNGHLRGLREFTPRITFNGPLIANKLWFRKRRIPHRQTARVGLAIPVNETDRVHHHSRSLITPSASHQSPDSAHRAATGSFFNLDFLINARLRPTSARAIIRARH